MSSLETAPVAERYEKNEWHWTTDPVVLEALDKLGESDLTPEQVEMKSLTAEVITHEAAPDPDKEAEPVEIDTAIDRKKASTRRSGFMLMSALALMMLLGGLTQEAQAQEVKKTKRQVLGDILSKAGNIGQQAEQWRREQQQQQRERGNAGIELDREGAVAQAEQEMRKFETERRGIEKTIRADENWYEQMDRENSAISRKIDFDERRTELDKGGNLTQEERKPFMIRRLELQEHRAELPDLMAQKRVASRALNDNLNDRIAAVRSGEAGVLAKLQDDQRELRAKLDELDRRARAMTEMARTIQGIGQEIKS